MKKMINRMVILGFFALFFITSAVAETWDQAKPGVMASFRKDNRRNIYNLLIVVPPGF